MITLTARINLLSASGAGSISSATSDINGINISGNIPVGQKKTVGNPFLIGLSVLDGGDTYSGGEDYFIGSVYANASGTFTTQYEITVSGSGISAFTICFDEQHGRFPHSITVDGAIYTDDDPNYTISVTQGNSHTIIIDNWNTPNYPLVISGIFVDLSIDLDYNRITGISREVRERSDISMPSWGILSSGGSLEFSDYDGEVLDYIEQNILKSGVEVTINLNNTLFGKTQSGEWAVSEQVAKYYVDDVDYDVNNKEVKLSVKDGLEKLQDVGDVQLTVNPFNYVSKSFSDIYDYLRNEVVRAGVEMDSYDDLDANTKSAFDNYVPVPITEEGNSLWQLLNKFAIATQTHIYMKQNGVLTCRYNGGN